MEETKLLHEEPVFALDIGTRTVIGIVGTPEDGLFHVLDVESRAYPRRAMIDGQIEDVMLVAQLVQEVKEALESRLNLSLHQAHIAAAGRALITQRAEFEIVSPTPRLLSQNEIRDLEMGAMQRAYQATGTTENSGDSFYCVGYSVLRYLLDDYPFSTLADHRGCRAKVEILATFLPSEVVDSLYAVMARAGLEPASLTLEPIAAINAIIPPELRIVNLALVDIGAGTSDIAISRDGSVAAYGMVTVAGDEITEEIIRAYLVEFDEAERIKSCLLRDKTVAFNNILGEDESLSSEEVLNRLGSVTAHLADVICTRILEMNENEPPAAVFLVGGGSRLPSLREDVAERLGLSTKKVAVGENNYMKRLILSAEKISGPEFVTPVGIAVTAAKFGSGSIVVSVNDKEVRLLKASGATVLDVLFACGYKYQQIIGRSGQSLHYEQDGRPMLLRGGHPTPAEITLNGQPTGITHPVVSGDQLAFVPAQSGGIAELEAASLLIDDASRGNVSLDGTLYRLGGAMFINGALAQPGQNISNGDSLESLNINNVGSLCRLAGLLPETLLFRGEAALSPDSSVYNGDILTTEATQIPVSVHKPTAPFYPSHTAEGEEASHDEPQSKPRPTDWPTRITMNDEALSLPPKTDGTPYQFLDLLSFSNIDPAKPPPSGNILLSVNGKPASYLQEIEDGDNVEIRWQP